MNSHSNESQKLKKRLKILASLLISLILVIVLSANYFKLSLFKPSLPGSVAEVETPPVKAEIPPSLKVKVGIGTSAPQGNMHVKTALKNTPGVLLEMPVLNEILSCAPPEVCERNPNNCVVCGTNPDCFKGRLAYRYGPFLQWQGGEQKFGKWRQHTNMDEDSWAIFYNSIYDTTINWCGEIKNGRRGKDVEDVSALMRFDMGEGVSSFWEMWWSKSAPAFIEEGNLNPGFGKMGAGYYMTMGCGGAAWRCNQDHDEFLNGTHRSAQLIISGDDHLPAILSLKTGARGINFRSAGVPQGSYDFEDIFTIDDINNKPLMIFNIPSPFNRDNDPDFGNVGIGVTSKPLTHKLTVAGTAGLTTGTTWTQISDSRYKDVQSELRGSSLEKIMALRPVSYQWNSLYKDKYGQKDGLNYGFIAQDVQKVIPEFVSQDKEGYLWYNPSGFEAILTAAMQERQKQIERLRTEIKELKIKYNL